MDAEESYKYGIGARVQLTDTQQTGIVKARYHLKEEKEQPSTWYVVKLDAGPDQHVLEDKLRPRAGS